ncbi:hypothetical protein O1Q96_24890 [Streptomyces sp. Qhu-G9]|uniref:hypothetical protein n=1 Tax=Streptomyces sp. Qhu-G9 TaxID=3452799 RepID=UPI0022ABDAB7|nr:hypothetical protein [Streptomyces aurantiacus]WAU86678.1 hypothetical protein O1Q96_24890 [Streptomyces aurantiacus]
MRLIRAVCIAAMALLVTSCADHPTASPHREIPASGQAQDDLIKSAQLALVARCLSGQGLGVPSLRQRPKSATAEDKQVQAAHFGTDPRELSLTLPTGYTVTANTDGCLANAQRVLYGNEKRWFEAEVVVNNLRAEAQVRMATDPDHRAAMARWKRCAGHLSGTRPDQPDPAVANRCNRESGLAEVESRLEPTLLAKVRTERREHLTAYRQLRTTALRRAANLHPASTAPQVPRRRTAPTTDLKPTEPKGHPPHDPAAHHHVRRRGAPRFDRSPDGLHSGRRSRLPQRTLLRLDGSQLRRSARQLARR